MRRSFVMPKLGLTMTEGILSEWSVQPGTRFERDQTVFVVETDKAANDIAAEGAGVLLEMVHAPGTTVPVGEVIGYWDDGQEATPPAAPTQGVSKSPAGGASASAVREAGTPVPARPGERLVATPLARREARERGIALDGVRGTGPNGRIKLADVPQFPRAAVAAREPASRIAAATAKRLVQSKREIPHFYLAREADVRMLLTLRKQLAAGPGARITLNTFLLAAVGRALVDEPSAARVWQDGELVHVPDADVGMAVHTVHGLFVPVVPGAGVLSLVQLAAAASDLAQRAREGQLQANEMAGAAITVSNAGMFDVTYMTPIINPGEAMILGVGSVRDLFRPDGAGSPELRRELGLVLACDHRVLDGVSGLRFLARVVHYLENPALLLHHRAGAPSPDQPPSTGSVTPVM